MKSSASSSNVRLVVWQTDGTTCLAPKATAFKRTTASAAAGLHQSVKVSATTVRFGHVTIHPALLSDGWAWVSDIDALEQSMLSSTSRGI